MSLLRHLFKPLREIKAELSARFDAEVRPEIDALTHAVDQVLEHPGRLEELRERALRLKHLLGTMRHDRAEAHVHWLEVRTHAQVNKAQGLTIYAALVGAVALMSLHGGAADVARIGFAAAAWVAGLGVLISLSALWLGWPPLPGTLSEPMKEADWLLDGLVRRAWQVNLAILAALVATVLLAVGVCQRLFG
jgi:hypothetical protein